MTPEKTPLDPLHTPPDRGGAQSPARRSAILPTLESPGQLREMDIPELKQLAREVRDRIIDVVARKGGHFGAPLGAVELAIALLHQYDTPRDKVVWDVGHQAYAWKILTGRNEEFETIRQYDGLSGFLKRKESEYDAFGAGHASTSLAAALGMAEARDIMKQDHRVAAVIGDGAMTGGMAYEALNNAGLRKSRMLVVFNDNEMSISNNVWVLQKVFRKTITSQVYNRVRKDVVGLIKRHSSQSFLEYAHRAEEAVKGLIVPGIFFEEMGFRYIGPIDGHDLEALTETLDAVKDLPGPICLHTITQKGKGYSFAENDPITYHAASNMKVETGVMKKSSGPPTYTQVFGSSLASMARRNRRIVAITAAMDQGTGLSGFAREFPDRFYDVGIAEECAVTMAAGMAAEGLRPVCAIYSTFLQRAYDQIIHDVALQELPVVFALDRAGLVGADGPTHHGAFDLSYLRVVPNLVVMAPKDEVELRDMVKTAIACEDRPVALRYPRGSGLGLKMPRRSQLIGIGRGEVLREGRSVALVGIGSMVHPLSRAAARVEAETGVPPTVVNARFVKPLDEELLLRLADTHDAIVTAEENAVRGGFGSAVAELLHDNGRTTPVRIIGIPDRFVEHGKPAELLREVGLDDDGLTATVLGVVRALRPGAAEVVMANADGNGNSV